MQYDMLAEPVVHLCWRFDRQYYTSLLILLRQFIMSLGNIEGPHKLVTELLSQCHIAIDSCYHIVSTLYMYVYI